jgi:hypothetical protein
MNMNMATNPWKKRGGNAREHYSYLDLLLDIVEPEGKLFLLNGSTASFDG